MRIAGLQKLTLLDFPDKTAATVFTAGCNLRCPFCHNAELATASVQDSTALLNEEEFFTFLEKRNGLLDGVCITGGEPLLQPGIEEFCQEVLSRGFSVKLDTNGFFPERLASLIDAHLIDYVAVDIKNQSSKYAETVGIPQIDIAPLQKTIDLLVRGEIDYEFRTTVVKELHSPADIFALATEIKDAQSWYLQSFVDSEEILAGQGVLHPWEESDLKAILSQLQATICNTHLRGL